MLGAPRRATQFTTGLQSVVRNLHMVYNQKFTPSLQFPVYNPAERPAVGAPTTREATATAAAPARKKFGRRV